MGVLGSVPRVTSVLVSVPEQRYSLYCSSLLCNHSVLLLHTLFEIEMKNWFLITLFYQKICNNLVSILGVDWRGRISRTSSAFLFQTEFEVEVHRDCTVKKKHWQHNLILNYNVHKSFHSFVIFINSRFRMFTDFIEKKNTAKVAAVVCGRKFILSFVANWSLPNAAVMTSFGTLCSSYEELWDRKCRNSYLFITAWYVCSDSLRYSTMCRTEWRDGVYPHNISPTAAHNTWFPSRSSKFVCIYFVYICSAITPKFVNRYRPVQYHLN